MFCDFFSGKAQKLVLRWRQDHNCLYGRQHQQRGSQLEPLPKHHQFLEPFYFQHLQVVVRWPHQVPPLVSATTTTSSKTSKRKTTEMNHLRRPITMMYWINASKWLGWRTEMKTNKSLFQETHGSVAGLRARVYRQPRPMLWPRPLRQHRVPVIIR